MSADALKLDNKNMRKIASEIDLAVNDYSNFGKKPFEKELEILEKMNTDFLAKFTTMVENLNDSNEKLTKKLTKISEMTKEIVDNFEEIDSVEGK